MNEEEQDKLEATIEKALSEKLDRKVVFAEHFKIAGVPLGKGETEIDVILIPKDPNIPAVCMDLLYLIRCYGEFLGIKGEEPKTDKKDSSYVC